MPIRPLPLAIAFAVMAAAASPAVAQLRPLVDEPPSREAAQDGVTVFLLNDGPVPAAAEGPSVIHTSARDGTPITLVPADGDAGGEIAPGGFARRRYVIAAAVPVAAPPVALAAATERVETGSRGQSAGFLDRFHSYEPVYGVFGLQDAGAKLQLSLALTPLGNTGAASGLHLAYTQTIFWAIDQSSGPIRATTYSPEVFYERPVGRSTQVAIGYRHDSNGEGDLRSIDINRIYLRANRQFALGDGWRIDVAPQAWFYFGDQGIAPDLDRYWGYTAVTASIAQDDGIKLSVFARGNPRTGRGAGELFVSYPIRRFGVGDVGLYVFGQAFTGYGEALSDFDRADSHARIGIALTR